MCLLLPSCFCTHCSLCWKYPCQSSRVSTQTSSLSGRFPRCFAPNKLVRSVHIVAGTSPCQPVSPCSGGLLCTVTIWCRSSFPGAWVPQRSRMGWLCHWAEKAKSCCFLCPLEDICAFEMLAYRFPKPCFTWISDCYH